jgi:hypothetical protein
LSEDPPDTPPSARTRREDGGSSDAETWLDGFPNDTDLARRTVEHDDERGDAKEDPAEPAVSGGVVGRRREHTSVSAGEEDISANEEDIDISVDAVLSSPL